MRIAANIFRRQSRQRLAVFAPLLLAATLGLAACNDTGPQATVDRPAAKTILAARPGVSPAGTSIAFISLAGAPDSVRKKLGEEMTVALAKRDVRLATTDKADYLIRGHLASFSAGRTTRVVFIWDMYGADKQRKRRLDDMIVLPATAADSWSLLSDRIIARIATRSSQAIAAYLTHTPEAIAAANSGRKPSSGAKISAAPGDRQDRNLATTGRRRVLSYAPVRLELAPRDRSPAGPLPKMHDR